MNGPKPHCPVWAYNEGLAEPEYGETFRHYVTRIGFDADLLLADLTRRTECVANVRLAHAIADRQPMWWQRHVEEFVSRFRHEP